MKSLLALMLLSSITAHAGTICIADLSYSEGYVEKVKYEANCEDGTSKKGTEYSYFVVLGLVHDWKKPAFETFDQVMKNENYTIVAKIPKQSGLYKLVYEQNPNSNSPTVVCTATKTRFGTHSLNEEVTFDLTLACSDQKEILQKTAVSQNQVDQYLSQRGFTLSYEENYPYAKASVYPYMNISVYRK